MSAPYYSDESVTLWHGDCREVDAWVRADVLVTDPPYGVAYSSNFSGAFKGNRIAGDDSEAVRDEVLTMWGDRDAVCFASYRQRPFGEPHPMPLVFDKGDVVGMGDLSWPWRPSYELAWVYGKGWTGVRGPAVLRFRVLPGNFTSRDHPTEKPVGLLESIIEKAAPGVIADPFAGSGSTLVAARNLGRRAVGVEVDEAYCEVIAKRLSQDVLSFGEPA